MISEELLQALKGIVLGMGKLLGEDTEVVLHDIEKKEIVYIVNGHITGRYEGYRLESSVYDAVINLADQDGHVIGYGSSSSKGNNLRSSHFVVPDEAGNPCALICINQDTAKLASICDTIYSMIRIRPLAHAEEPKREDENYIQQIMQQVIADSIEKMKPTAIDTKEGKMEIVRRLEVKGVFAVKDAVPYVCKALSISQATLYNYLRELRNQSTSVPKSSIPLY